MDELAFGLNTFYFVMMGALVMWMAAGFTMLEAGLVRKKNTAEIVTKNIGLYSIASVMFMVCGYSALYASGGNGVLPEFTFDLNLVSLGTCIQNSLVLNAAKVKHDHVSILCALFLPNQAVVIDWRRNCFFLELLCTLFSSLLMNFGIL